MVEVGLEFVFCSELSQVYIQESCWMQILAEFNFGKI